MAWVETQSPSFTARHASEDAHSAMALLGRLERFREELSEVFETTPGDVSAVMHSHDWQLALAHPWLPLARRVAAPASRRYFAGWFSSGEIHVLAPSALERRASGLPESAAALELTTPACHRPSGPGASRATSAGRGCARVPLRISRARPASYVRRS